MITRQQLIAARKRAGYPTQQSLADALGVVVRTVGEWERKTDTPKYGHGAVSEGEESRVRELLWPAPVGLEKFSDIELLSEVGRRLATYRNVAEGTLSGENSDEGRNSAEPGVNLAKPPGEGAIDGTLGRRPRSDDGE